MSLSRMHFQQLADILAKHGVNNNIIEDVANFCNEHNERFDVDRFFEASGYTKNGTYRPYRISQLHCQQDGHPVKLPPSV